MTQEWSAELVLDAGAALGEGPSWDAVGSSLVWVDITRGLVHRVDEGGREQQPVSVGTDVGAALPAADGGLLLATRDGFRLADAAGEVRPFLTFLDDRPGLRMNDATCDRRGRAFGGSLADDGTPGGGSLYRLEAGPAVVTLVDAVTVSNGLGWSPADDRMYYVDSPTERVDVFAYDLDDGAPSGRATLVDLRAAGQLPPGCVPDGLCVDDSGALWVAVHGAGAVHRYTPDGRLDAVVRVPTRMTTSCAFGGVDGATLFITTAAGALSDAERRAEPYAGGLFAVRPGVTGPPATPWRDPTTDPAPREPTP